MVNTSSFKKWSCRCGKVSLKLRGEPIMLANCHCLSCACVMRHLDAKPSPGTSAQVSADNPGVAKAFYFLEDVEFGSPPEEILAFLKVGEGGINVRSYTKCCGTLMNTAGGSKFPASFRPFNRNCITNDDGSRYQPPPDPPVPNILASAAFDPAAVPEPKYNSATWTIVWTFFSNIMSFKLFGPKQAGSLKDNPALWKKGSDGDVEVVPITWE